MPGERFDYIVVGGGTAGCVVAARLSEDPGTRVLLLEAGGSDRKLIVAMPAAVPFAYASRALGWGYQSGPEPQLAGRTIDEKRGKVLGGTSSINAMIFNRGNPLDYVGWAAAKLPEWDWPHCLPYFKRMESFSGGADAWRGGSGPLHISRCKAEHKLYDCFFRAGEQAGHAQAQDHNGFRQEGLHVAQAYIHGGVRVTTARAYLRPARQRTNLTVRTHATVEAIVLDGRRAVGVRVRGRNGAETLTCEREVILCAGAFASPQLLMLSGIGDGAHLREHGIEVAAHLPGVGRNLENHPGVNIQYATTHEDSVVAQLGPVGRARLGLEWLLFKRGLGTTNFFEVGAFLRTREDIAWPNVQFEFLPLVRFTRNDRLHARPGFQFWMDLSRPLSRGRVSLRSADPSAHPAIVFNHLAEDEDRRDLVDAVKLARRLVAQHAWDGVRREELSPGPDVRSDGEISAWLKPALGSSYHPSGTCRMGLDDQAVVDSAGRVHGIDGLRVVDAAIMPRSITANLSAAIVMLAEKLSDSIRGRPAMPPDRAPFFVSSVA